MSLVTGNKMLAGVGLIAGILVLVILAVSINSSFGLPMNLNLSWPPGQDYSLKAAFTDANGVARGATVVVAGNPIGQVTDIRAVGRKAVVTMRIERHYAPLHKGTIGRIRYSTLLAQKYIELSPAAGTPAIADGAIIPTDQTVTPVDFDQFLGSLDPDTRKQLQVLIQQGASGVDGRSGDLNHLLDQLAQLSAESRAGLSTLHARDRELDSITGNLATTSQRLAQSHQQLGDLIASTAVVNGQLAANDLALDSLLVHLANTMDDFNQTLDGNEQNLRDTVVTFDPFLTQANSTLAVVNPDLYSILPTFTTWGTHALIPEVLSAISDPRADANGNYLRQYLVTTDDCYNHINPPGCTAPAVAPPAATAPNLGGAGLTLPTALPGICPTVPPLPKLPTPLPVPTITACPTPIPPCVPSPGHPKPTPTPTIAPGSCIPGPGTINPGGPPIPLPQPSLPGLP